jgi:hypothetical protein
MIDAKASGMTDSTFSGREAILFNNNYFKDQPNAVYYDPTKPLTEEQKIKFKADYKKFVLDGLPNEQVVPGYKPVEKEEIVEVKAKTTGGKPAGGKGGTTTPKTKEKTSKEILSENLNGSYSSPGSLFDAASGSNRVKVGSNGKLYKVDEDEDKISEKPLTLKEARIYLGLPANGVLTVKK